MGPAKAGGACLIIFENVILMLDYIENLKFSKIEILESSQKPKIFRPKIKGLPLLQKNMTQPVLSIQPFISDLKGQCLRKVSKKQSKVQTPAFPINITFFCKKKAVSAYAEKTPKIEFID